MAITEELRSTDHPGNVDTFKFSSHVDARALGINTAETITVPTKARYVLFSSTGDFYVKKNGTAAVPADVSNGSASELNPTLRSIADVGTLGLISPAACVVTMSWFK